MSSIPAFDTWKAQKAYKMQSMTSHGGISNRRICLRSWKDGEWHGSNRGNGVGIHVKGQEEGVVEASYEEVPPYV